MRYVTNTKGELRSPSGEVIQDEHGREREAPQGALRRHADGVKADQRDPGGTIPQPTGSTDPSHHHRVRQHVKFETSRENFDGVAGRGLTLYQW